MTLFNNCKLKRFLWKIAGADAYILNQSGEKSQKSFQLIGLLFAVVNVIIAIGFFGLFFGVFNNLFIALFGTLILGFLISNIYRLTLISLEPQVLPTASNSVSKIYSNTLRFATIIAFAFFVSKTFEMVLIGLLESASLVNYDGTSGYLFHMFTMNDRYPSLWLITMIIIGFFIIPIYLKYRLRNSTEYYSLKRRIDRQIVEDNYSYARRLEHEAVSAYYLNEYVEVIENKEGRSFYVTNSIKLENKVKPEKYEDPPFNTKLKVRQRSLKSSEEFTSMFGKV